jgi:magnesium-transporting ATPase (P-type)
MVNLVTDGLPALAFARDPAGAGTMTSPPRGGAHLFEPPMWLGLAAIGALVGASTLAAFGAGRLLGGDRARDACPLRAPARVHDPLTGCSRVACAA